MRATLKRALGAFTLATGLAGMAFAGFAGTDLFLPMVGRQAGVHPSNWYTKVWIYNPGAEPVTARLYLLQRNTANPAPPWVDVTVGAGETEAIDNVVETLFQAQVMGAMRITSPARIVVTSRVYSKAVGLAEKDSVGQDFAGVPAAFAIGPGEKTQVLGVHQTVPSADSSMRFNYGFVETTGHSATVRITVLDGNGAVQGSEDLQVLAWSQRQVAFKDHFPAVSTENARLELEVISGSGKVIAYGSAIANGSQDPTTFDMSYADALVAGGTISGVTAGEGLTGGGVAGSVTVDVGAGEGISVDADTVGIADAGVTPAKIAPSATVGQVLATIATGGASPGEGAMALAATAVGWQDDGLALPYTGVKSSAVGTDIFTIVNSGAGRAIHAISGTDTAIWAQSSGGIAGVDARNTTGKGVSASSTSGTGVYGTSASGLGVWGKTTSGDAGVYGEHAGNGEGVYGFSQAGVGVRGSSNGSSGVFGISSHTGVFGESDGTGAYAIGVNGYTTTDGSGVWGSADGTGFGVRANSVGGEGIFGEGPGNGVHGRCDNIANNGVYGEHTAGGHGVYGATTSASKAGVYGNNGGTGPGVKGNSSDGTGVYGISATTDITGARAGVLGENIGSGQGVLGKSGTGRGVWAVNASSTQAALSASNNGNGDVIDGWHGALNRVFRVANDGQVWADGAYHSTGADFAEMLPASDGLEPGDVLVIAADGRLARSSEAYQGSVAGVFSTQPGYLGGSGDSVSAESKVPLAIVGIVPVKASAENGAIRPGDMLVASATPGHAMRASSQPPVGTVIGKALTGVGDGMAVITALVFLH